MNVPRSLRLLALSLTPVLASTAVPRGIAAQEPYTVQGTVLDAATQRPLPNVAVTLRGTQTGTLTDPAGRYNLIARVAPGSYTLTYALIGRGEATRPLTLGTERTVQVEPVALRETAVELEGIVVTGAGVATERRRLGNVVESVAGQAINEAPAAPSIDAALQGKVTGAVISQNHGQPGGGVSIRLRGTSSILGGAEPLIVVDGILVDNSAGALVGLGANATHQGAAMQNRLADLAPADIERIEIIKGAAAAALYGSRANNGVIQVFTRRGQAGVPQVTFRTEASSSWRPGRVPLLMSPLAGPGDVLIGAAENVGDPVQRFDYQDEIFRTGFGTTNQLSITGGTEGTRYYMSGWWNTEEGIIRGQGNERISARGRIDQRLLENLDVGLHANFIRNRTDFIPEGEQTEGVFTSLIFTPTSWNPHFNPELGRYPYNPLLNVNPFDVIENWIVDSNVDRLVGGVDLNWRPLEQLQLSYLFGLDQVREENIYLRPPLALGPAWRGEIQHPMRNVNRYTSDFTATHTAQLSPNIDLRTTAGTRYTFDRTDIVRAAASDLPPQQQTVAGAVQVASQAITEVATIGGFLQGQLGVGNLTLTGGLNVEGSSAFGEDERWQLFPRLGASYVISDEPYWRNSAIANTVSSLRLRGSYGETGGQPPGAYFRFDNYVTTAYGGRAGLVSSTIAGNPNLRPERQREWEGGFDVGFAQDRVGLEVTGYDQRTSDLVLAVPIHLSAGYTTQYQNVGEVSNRGLEVTLNTLNVQRPDFSWRTRLSYAANRNRVEQLFGDVDQLPLFGYMSAVREGEPIGVFWARIYARNPDGSLRMDSVTIGGQSFLSPLRATDAQGNEIFQIVGDPNPDFTLSMNNEFQIGRDLQLGVLLDGRFGNDVANFTRRIQEFFGLHPNNEQEITGEVSAARTVGHYRGNTIRHLIYEEWIEDGSFVKLREIVLRYRFEQPWVRALGARSLDVSLAGRNLHTWTNYSGLDPEINLFAANTVARGVDFGTTPIPRRLVLGVTASF